MDKAIGDNNIQAVGEKIYLFCIALYEMNCIVQSLFTYPLNCQGNHCLRAINPDEKKFGGPCMDAH